MAQMIHPYGRNCKGGILMTKIWETLQALFQLYISSLMEGQCGPEKTRSERIGIAARQKLRI